MQIKKALYYINVPIFSNWELIAYVYLIVGVA